MKCYLVTCVRGHMGTGQDGEITFAIKAKDAYSASCIAKKMGSVKHSRGVLNTREIDEQTYNEYRKISAYDRCPHGNKINKKRVRSR